MAEAMAEPPLLLVDLPSDLLQHIAGHLRMELGSLLILCRVCRGLNDALNGWVSKQTTVAITDAYFMADLGAPGAHEALRKLFLAAAIVDRRLPSLRCLRVGGSRVHLEWLRKASKSHTVTTLDLEPMLDAAKRVEDEFAICLFAARWVQHACRRPPPRRPDVFPTKKLQYVQFDKRATLELWPARPAMLDFEWPLESGKSILGQRGTTLLGALLAADVNEVSARLSSLRLDGNEIGYMGSHALGSALGMGAGVHLRELCLTANDLDAHALAMLLPDEAKGVPALERLELTHNAVGSDGMMWLAHCLKHGGLRLLTVLKIGDTHAQGEGAVDLCRELRHATGLRVLDASCNQLPDGALAALGEALPQLTALARLDLSAQVGDLHNFYGDKGVAALCAGLKAARLAALMLTKYNLSDVGLNALSDCVRPPENAPCLRTLEVGGHAVHHPRKYSNEGATALRKAICTRNAGLPNNARLVYVGNIEL